MHETKNKLKTNLSAKTNLTLWILSLVGTQIRKVQIIVINFHKVYKLQQKKNYILLQIIYSH